jgi:hypothetical protein
MARTSRKRGGPAGEPSAPPGLRSARFQRGDDEMAVLSFPLLPATLPDSQSEAERKVALGLIAGKSTAEIAAERRTSVGTVANQIGRCEGKRPCWLLHGSARNSRLRAVSCSPSILVMEAAEHWEADDVPLGRTLLRCRRGESSRIREVASTGLRPCLERHARDQRRHRSSRASAHGRRGEEGEAHEVQALRPQTIDEPSVEREHQRNRDMNGPRRTTAATSKS